MHMLTLHLCTLRPQVASLTQGAEPLHEQLVTLREALTDQAGQLSKAQVAAKEASQELQVRACVL
jgi:hypothetical protein